MLSSVDSAVKMSSKFQTRS